jgi:hypothetical protein
MKLHGFLSTLFGSDRRSSATKRPSRRRPPTQRRRTFLHLEEMEVRLTPASFSFLDTFSGASFSDPAVNSAGTGNRNAANQLVTGAILATNGQASDLGTDTALRTGPQVGVATPTSSPTPAASRWALPAASGS